MRDDSQPIESPTWRGGVPDDSSPVVKDQFRTVFLVGFEELNSYNFGARVAATATAVLCILGIGILHAGSVI